jgi:hypothetical protein
MGKTCHVMTDFQILCHMTACFMACWEGECADQMPIMSTVTLPPDKALAGQTLLNVSVVMQMQVSFYDRYSFYDHIVCTRLMPIEKAATATMRLRHRNSHIDYGDCVQLTGSIMTRKVKLWCVCLLQHNSVEQHMDYDIVLLYSNRKKAS